MIDADRETILRMHARVTADLNLALSMMMTEDERSARELLDAKRAANELDRTATLAASKQFLSALRNLRRVNSDLSTIGYAVVSPSRPSTSGWAEIHPPREVG
jgi:Na+/phosphate symporter